MTEIETAYIEHVTTILSVDEKNTKRNFYWLRFVKKNTDGSTSNREACFIFTRSGFVYYDGETPPDWVDDDPKWDKIFYNLVRKKIKKFVVE